MLIFVVYLILILWIIVFMTYGTDTIYFNTVYDKKYKKCVKFSNPLIKSIHIY